MTSRGARAGLALLIVALAAPAGAQAPAATGQAAFERRDFAAARALWLDEAAAGSAKAEYGLGLIADLGLGRPRDAATALRWYLEAAAGGLAEAQFNVAVMLDSGAGAPRDPVAAAVWYARAAANGDRRAQYNLGLLYEAGDGAPKNPDLARYWLREAAEALPAAGERLARLGPALPEDEVFVAPALLAGAVVEGAAGRRAELVWSAPPAPAQTHFRVEIARLPNPPETWGEILLSEETGGSALTAPLPDGDAGFAWRVSLVDEGAPRYAGGEWRALGAPGRPAPEPPKGMVTIRAAPGDGPALRLADELAKSFAEGGLWVRVEEAAGAVPETAVLYAYDEDAALAGAIATFLPVLGPEDAVRTPAAGAPGEITIRLVGGPD